MSTRTSTTESASIGAAICGRRAAICELRGRTFRVRQIDVLARCVLLFCVSSAMAEGTDEATPLVSGSQVQCSCSGDTRDGSCLVEGATLMCPQNCSISGQKLNDACQPSGSICQKAPAVTRCSGEIAEGRYRLRLPEVRLDNGQLVCLNSRNQDKHRRLQQFDCSIVVDESSFFFDQKDADGCYTMRPTRSSPNTVLGILADGGDRFVAEMGTKPSCQAGADQYHWDLVPVDTSSGRRFQIKNKLTGQCMDADNNSRTGGGKVQPLDCRNVNNQHFVLDRQP